MHSKPNFYYRLYGILYHRLNIKNFAKSKQMKITFPFIVKTNIMHKILQQHSLCKIVQELWFLFWYLVLFNSWLVKMKIILAMWKVGFKSVSVFLKPFRWGMKLKILPCLSIKNIITYRRKANLIYFPLFWSWAL